MVTICQEKNASNLICHILLALNNSRAAEVIQTLRWLISDDDNIAKKRRHQTELGNDQLQHFRFPQGLNLGDSRFPLGLIPSNVRFQWASTPAILDFHWASTPAILDLHQA